MIRTRTLAQTLWFAVLLTACGSGVEPGDSGLSMPDTPAPDVDGDGDGVPSSRDCDDADPAISSTSSRSCMNECGTGTEQCTDGAWSACTAPTDCRCDTEGATRIGTCGLCGMQSQTCRAGTWQGVSSCLDEGVCVFGAVESREGPLCDRDERLCGADCRWGDWLQAVPEGDCVPGASRECDSRVGYMRCTEMCEWTTGECM